MIETVELSSIAEINMGQSPKSEYYTENSLETPFLQGNRTFGEKYPYFDTYCTKPTKMAKKRDVIFTVRAPVGEINVAPDNLCIGRGVSSLSSINNSNEWLYYLLKANQGHIRKSGNGTVFNSVTRLQLEKLKIFVPDRDISKEIKTLSKMDEKISKNNELITDLEEYSQLLFYKWFVDFNFPDKTGKPYKDSGGEMIEVDGKMMAKDWDFVELDNYIGYDKGISYKSSEINDNSAGLPMINLNSFDRQGGYKSSGIKYYNGQIKDNKIIKPFDLIVACTDVTRNAEVIGSPILIPEIHGYKLIGSCDVAKLIVKKPLNEFYVYRVLKQNHYKRYIKGFTNGTNVLHLNLKGISKYKTPIPEKSILDKFTDLEKTIEHKKSKLMKENQLLTETRDLLIKKLIK